MERAHYEGINNQVTAIDLDVIPCGFDWEVICESSKRMGSGDWRKLLDASCYWSIGENRSLGKKHSELPTCPHLFLSKEISAVQFPSRKLTIS